MLDAFKIIIIILKESVLGKSPIFREILGKSPIFREILKQNLIKLKKLLFELSPTASWILKQYN
jgi:hypothetical protein